MAYITGKQRASRIPLDYYKHPDRMVRTKRVLTWGAGLLTVVWIGTAFIPAGPNSPLGEKRFSHGPVATPHQAIDADCAACHVNFAVFASGKPFKGDQKCQQCHYEGTLAAHHQQKVDMTPNCGKCHSDHHGRDWNLNRVADRDCTNCHKDLKESVEGGRTPPEGTNVATSFAEQHPEFRDLKKGDPGKLKFNHKYHMTPGIVLTSGGEPFRVSNMRPGPQRDEILRSQKEGDPVKLECASCHKPESRDEVDKGDWPLPTEDRAGWENAVQKYYRTKLERRGSAGSNLLPPRKPGAYMAPIHYENHCASCHPLSFDPDFKQQQAPHRLQPDKLKAYLTKFYKENEKNLSGSSRPAAFLPLPGKRSGGLAGGLVGERTEMALRALLEGRRACGECHLAKDDSAVTLYTKEIARPNIPEIWLEHARFDHSAHTSRGISCIVCHKEAYPNRDAARNEQEVLASSAQLRQGAEAVMIGGLKECRQCHSPKPEPKFADAGLQAKNDCTECHTYHNGPAGLGSAAGAFHNRSRRELEAWLRRK